MSTSGPPRPKLRGLRSWFRTTFSRPSSRRPAASPSPQIPISHTPVPLKTSVRPHTAGNESEKQDVVASSQQRPNIVQSATAPPVISAETVDTPSVPPPPSTVHEIHETDQPSEQPPPSADQQPSPADSVTTFPVASVEHVATQANLPQTDPNDTNNLNAGTDQPGEHDVALPIDYQPLASQSMSEPSPILEQAGLEFSPPDSPAAEDTTIELVEIENTAWSELQTSLQTLRNTSGVLGSLSLAVDMLLECMGTIETAARSQADYEDLATDLATLSNWFTEHFQETRSDVTSDCVSGVVLGIERQAKEIRSQTEGGVAGRLVVPGSGEELIRHYRRVQSLFRQLQANLGMSTWIDESELLANTRLEGLNPESQAMYNSELSTSINRRACTEGTRTDVLANLVNWVYDQDALAVYWMSGIAGAGKTTIAYTFSEWLERHELLAASFFCTRMSTDCRDVSRIIPTVVHQLARYSVPFQSALCDILGAEPDAGSKSVTKQFERLLYEPLKQMKGEMLDGLVVVIDALDECDDSNKVKILLNMLLRYGPKMPLKFLITSRPKTEIQEKMTQHAQSRTAVHLHDIEESLVQADIEEYLKTELAFMSPSLSDIEQLAECSGPLFIYAATLVRYIQPISQSVDPQRRLQSVLTLSPSAVQEHARVDALYTAVLNSVLGGQEADEPEVGEAEDLRAVLRTVLLAQEPIRVETIAELAGIDEPRRVKDALLQLRSVLHQSKTTGLVSTLHTSFPDFMFNSGRSGSYFCDILEQSQLMAEKCFLAMAEQLRFNICDLESSFVPDDRVENMQARIKKNISPSLAYACCHWAHHLDLVPKSDNLLQMLDRFLSDQLLFWMEVLSLRKGLTAGVESLLKAKQWLSRAGYLWADLVLFAEDARQFVADFTTSRASQSTPHIYISSLPSCPRSSLVYKHYWERTRGLLELKGSLMERRGPMMLATWKIGSQVRSVAYSPDGSRVAVGCGDGTVNIHSAYDDTVLVGPLEGHTGSVRSVAFSPNGKLLASGSWDKTIRVWDVNDGTLVAGPIEGHTGWIYSVSFSPDSTRIASSSQESTIRIWDACDGTLLLGPIKGHTGSAYAVAFSPDGSLIASSSVDGTIRLWDANDGTPAADPMKGHARTIGAVVFTPDGTRLVSGSNDHTIRVWNTSNGSLATNPFKGHTGNVNSVAVSPDGTRVASGSDDRTVRVWNIDDGTLVAGPFLGHAERISSVAFSSDGTRVISGSWDKTVRVWNVRDGAPSSSTQIQDAVSNINSISFTSDGHILSSSIDHTIRIWNPSDGSFTLGQYKARFFPPPLLDSSPDRSYIASTSEAGQIQIMSTIDGSLAAGPLGVKYTSISAFRFSYDSATVIIGCNDGTIRVQDLSSGRSEARLFVGHGGVVTSIAQSPDCSLLASYCDEDKTMRVWNMLEPTLELDSHNSVSDPGYDTWHVKKDGWVRNHENHPLFWLPPEVASVWKSPYASLIVAKSGVLQIPKQQLLVGNQWSKCYIQEEL